MTFLREWRVWECVRAKMPNQGFKTGVHIPTGDETVATSIILYSVLPKAKPWKASTYFWPYSINLGVESGAGAVLQSHFPDLKLLIKFVTKTFFPDSHTESVSYSSASGLLRPFYAAAEITPSQAGRHSGCEPETPALHLKLVSQYIGQRGNCDCGKSNKVSGLQFQTGNLFIYLSSFGCCGERVPKLWFKLYHFKRKLRSLVVKQEVRLEVEDLCRLEASTLLERPWAASSSLSAVDLLCYWTLTFQKRRERKNTPCFQQRQSLVVC